MKKVVVVLVMMMFTVCLFGQVPETEVKKQQYAYCELVGTLGAFNKKLTVEIDFGQEQNFWKTKDARIRTEDGKVRKFNSMVDAMNYMGALGWEFAQAYVVTTANQHVYRWLLKKAISEQDMEELKKMIEKEKTE
jgi:hypothetical protein